MIWECKPKATTVFEAGDDLVDAAEELVGWLGHENPMSYMWASAPLIDPALITVIAMRRVLLRATTPERVKLAVVRVMRLAGRREKRMVSDALAAALGAAQPPAVREAMEEALAELKEGERGGGAPACNASESSAAVEDAGTPSP